LPSSKGIAKFKGFGDKQIKAFQFNILENIPGGGKSAKSFREKIRKRKRKGEKCKRKRRMEKKKEGRKRKEKQRKGKEKGRKKRKENGRKMRKEKQ
jgi:hypothetical protein